jgi:hypothetical protein
MGRQDIDLAIAACPQEIDQESVGGLQSDYHIRGGDLRRLTRRVEFLETLGRMGNGKVRDDFEVVVQEYDVVLAFTPINSDVYLHLDLLVHMTGGPLRGRRDRVPIRALQARHALDGASCRAWGTVRTWRSHRRVLEVLVPKPVADGVSRQTIGSSFPVVLHRLSFVYYR